MGKWAEDNERLRNDIEERHAQMENDVQKSRKNPWPNQSLMVKIRGLQAGDGRRGSTASQAHGCCFDAGLLQQFVTMGAEQAMQLSALHGELSNIFEMQHQPAQVTPVHVPKRNEEEEGGENMKRNRGAARRVAKVNQGAAMNLFRLVLFLILQPLPRSNAGDGDGDEFNSPGEGGGDRADRCARREVWTNAGMCKEDPVHLGNSNNSSRLK